MYWPLRRVGMEFHAEQNSRAAADKALSLIGAGDPAPAGLPSQQIVTARGAEIRFERLSVTGRDHLAPCDLTAVIEPGKVTVLTGRNGAGKSTTLQAIARLTTPSPDRATVAGVDVADLSPDAWWQQLTWLPQRPVLIPGTVGDNLVLLGGLDNPEFLEIDCAIIGFDTILDNLPYGMDTTVGRGGVGLSLGQQQRLGLARALGSDASVLLLD